METEALKQKTADRAIEFVEAGMVLGLGSGSTVVYALRRLGELIEAGELRDIVGVPTSETTAQRARNFGIPLTTLEAHPRVDLTIDGADEVDPDLNLIKGLGGALLREKIIASVTNRLVIVADETKLVSQLGTHAPLSIEVVPFGWHIQKAFLEDLGATPRLRHTDDGNPYVTDGGHHILDCAFDGIDDAYALATTLSVQPGIVEHGLFLDMTDTVIVAKSDGVQTLTKTDNRKM